MEAHRRPRHLLRLLQRHRPRPWPTAPLLRQLLRVRIVSAREAGVNETQEGLLQAALAEGIELAGYRLSAEFVGEFQSLVPATGPTVREIGQDMLGGGGLWLRAEPDEDEAQADALAAILAIGIKA